MSRTRIVGAASLALLVALGVGFSALLSAQGGAQAPRLEVDPLWPQPFPHDKHWTLGSVTGVTVDAQNHVWVTHRGLPSLQNNEKGPTAATWAGECCWAAPVVLEFDATGKMLNNWGGTSADYQWPQNPAGITVDGKGNVWIAAGGLPVVAGGGRGRGAAPAPGAAPAGATRGGAPVAGAAPAPGGADPAAGRGGRGGGGAPGAPPAGADPAAGRGGRGGRGGAAPGAGGPPPAGAPPAAAQGGRGAAEAPAGRGGAAPPVAAVAPPPPPPPPPADAHILKFSKTGQFVAQFGTPGNVGTPDSTTTFNGPTAIAVDDAANEVFVADSGNRRVVVIDATTGAYKRHWFGSGDKTSSPAPAPFTATLPAVRGFRDVSCIEIARDGMVYVCDSASNRVQVFQKNGTFVKEGVVKAGTGGLNLPPLGGAQGGTYAHGSAWDVAFSNDAAQRFLYVADGMNKTVWILDRSTLAPVSRFGQGGRLPGTFYMVGSVAVDSLGNVYTGEESDGKRVQKFINRGMGPAQPLN